MRMHIKPVYSITLIMTAVLLIIISYAYIKKRPQKEEVRPKYVPGEVIAKIKQEVKKNFAKAIKSRNPKNTFYRDTKLYELGNYDIREVKHLFPYYTFKEPHLTEKQKEAVKKTEQKKYMPKIREKLSMVLLMKCSPETDIESLCKEMEKLPCIEYAEPNYYCSTTEFPEDLPNDTYVEDMWGLRAINMKPVDSPTAWSLSQGEGIVVAVIDTGIDYTHEDLEENIWINPGELPGDFDTDGDGVISFEEWIARLEDYNNDGVINLRDLFSSPHEDGVDDDANGFIDDFIGGDFVNNDNEPFDDHYHGTHVAGTIAAVGNNGKGIIGVAPKARLMGLKGLDYDARGSIEGLAQCIVYAANNGARVLNNSWGGPGESDLMNDVISYAHYIKGSVVVASAGNYDDNAIYYSPANINEVITVAAMDPDGTKASYSNWGSIIDVIAPGTDILSVYSSSGWLGSEGEYLSESGTSMAAPHVSGLAALILSRNRSVTNEQVNQIIRVSAVDVTDPLGDGADYTGFDIYTGYGLINTYRALQMDSALECRITQVNILESRVIEIKGIVNGPNFRSYSLAYQIEEEDVWYTIVTDDTTPHSYILDGDGNPIFDTLGSFRRVQGGTYIIRLEARDIYDNTYIDRYVVQNVILQNRPPELEPVGDKSVDEGETLSFTVSATDPDGDPLTYSVRYLLLWEESYIDGPPPGATFSDQIFTWPPTYDQEGTYSVTFTVSDGLEEDSETITITVNNINRPPELVYIGDQSVNEGEMLSFTVSATDPDGDSLTYTVSELPTGAVFEEGTFTWPPTYDQEGTYSVTFTVSDGLEEDSETITITVNNINRPPVLEPIGDKSVDEGETLSFTVSATDLDGDSLTYTVSELPTGAVFEEGTFTWPPTYDQEGTYSVTFTVSDGTLTDSETITITVNNINRPPELVYIGDQSVNEGEMLSFTVSATDPDGDSLTYSASGLPTGASFDTTTRTFSWTPTYTQEDTYTVTFTVSDGELTDSETITITVNNINRPPELVYIGDQSVNEGEMLSFTVSATDPDGDSLTYSASGLPTGASFDTTTRTFTWTPTYDQAGTYTVTFTVSDGSEENSETITITVNNVNRPPILNPIGYQKVRVGSRLRIRVSATDPDGDSLSYSATGLPSGARFTSRIRLFMWNPRLGQEGRYFITFTVTDNGTPALEDSENVRIDVIPRGRRR